MEHGRANLIIEGKVQGVCYRYETRDEAQELNVTGWVKNRIDGSVEVIVEGKKESVKKLITWCQTGPPLAEVTKLSVSWEKYLGEFVSFSIAY